MTLTELIAEIDQRLSSSMAFDESTLRKKLKEYAEEGIIRMEKTGRKVLYSRAPDTDITALRDVIDFFSDLIIFHNHSTHQTFFLVSFRKSAVQAFSRRFQGRASYKKKHYSRVFFDTALEMS